MRVLSRMVLAASVVGALMLAVGVSAASAEAPANDTYAGATVVSVPYSSPTTLDTRDATMDDDDAAVGTACGIVPGTGTYSHSVWYAFTADQDGTIALSTAGSSYSIGGAVLTGSPPTFSAVSCFLDSATFSVQAGQTYVIDLLDRSELSVGGDLALSLQYVVPPTATVALTGGRFDPRTGEATISGTATCANGDLSIGEVALSQDVGRIATIRGYGYGPWMLCDGSSREWSAIVDPYSGKFAGGKAQLSLYWFVWGPGGYDSGSIDETIILKGR